MKKALLSFLFACSCTTYVISQFNCTGLSTTTVGYTGSAQHFTVPVGVGQVRIRIKGGDGGPATSLAVNNNAGGGATVYGYFAVVPGDFFTIIIGQRGGASLLAGGGGGASAVYKNGTLVLVAGGGGGEDDDALGSSGSAVTANNGENGLPIETSTICDASHINNSRGGISGNGGNAGEECPGNPNGGGGGGGLLSAGNGKNFGYDGGGQGNINGAYGGGNSSSGPIGGFGWAGGGGGNTGESGGGGGYSGGGGAGEGLVARAGGGGSFITSGSGITISGSTAGVGTFSPQNGEGIICAPLLIVLPLKLLEFTATQNNNAVLLQWKTSNQINTSHFIVERSSINGAFTAIGKVNATTSNNTFFEYNFIDNSFINEDVIYRIKMVDNDGSLAYSPNQLVKANERTFLNVYPNPATKIISIALPTTWKDGNKLIQIINVSGKVVLQKYTTVINNNIEVAQLPSGTYFIRAIKQQTNEVISKVFQR